MPDALVRNLVGFELPQTPCFSEDSRFRDGELVVAQGGYASAFETYEQRLRPYGERKQVERKQKAACDFAASFVPRSAYGLWLRNATIRRELWRALHTPIRSRPPRRDGVRVRRWR